MTQLEHLGYLGALLLIALFIIKSCSPRKRPESSALRKYIEQERKRNARMAAERMLR